jgi:hypothetical protein
MRIERTIMALGALGVAFLSAPASAALDPADAMALCSRLTTKEARLECYDQVAKDVAEGRIQNSPSQAAAPAQAPSQAPSQSWSPPPPPRGVTASGPSWAAPPMPSGQGSTTGAGGAAASGPSGFGSESVKRSSSDRRDDSGAESIQAEVLSATDNGLLQWRITLADGAIWQMTERSSQFRPPAPHEVVRIRKGALGGFLMDVGKQASVRVTRVK